MRLTVWTYEGPPHVGAMRIATAMRDVHYVLHAPQGDTYADLLFTMIERRDRRPPVSYTTFKARDLGADTAAIFQRSLADTWERFRPQAILVGASCTAELLQDDPEGLASALDLPVPVVPLSLPSYQRKENWGAAETFYQLVRHLARAKEATPPSGAPAPPTVAVATRPRCNLLGPSALGFRHRDDVTEIYGLLQRMGIDVAVTAPLGATVADIQALPLADFNVLLYPEIGEPVARWLEREHGQPYTRTVPIGVGATRDFIMEVAGLAGIDATPILRDVTSRLPWYSRSVDSNYLTGKRVFIFGDATHAMAAVRVAREEMGFEVVGLGTYSREFARPVRALAESLGLRAVISDDYLEVEEAITALQPELILGTQMERHIAKRLRVPCAVISAPVHVQDYPARFSPQMGFEGANVLFDTWVHPLMMGLEEHLITMFREDFEFHDAAGASHLGASGARPTALAPAASQDPPAEHPSPAPADLDAIDQAPLRERPHDRAVHDRLEADAVAREPVAQATDAPGATNPVWSAEAERELSRIPFFVRGKARRNTERFAQERGIREIALETLYDAKAHYAR